MPGIAAKLLFGFILTVAAIFALLIVVGLIAGLLAPFVGSVPISYNFRSIRARWTSTIVAVLGIAGTVGVFVAMLSLANGFKATLVASGSRGNALILRAGSPTEMMGGVTLDSVRVVQDAPGVARDSSGPLVTQEVVGVMPFPLISTGTDANVQVRGVSSNVLRIRTFAKITDGRMFQPGLSEIVVGRNASRTYVGLTVGNSVRFGSGAAAGR
jgi:putative ABC transport system permease protein